MSSRRHQRRKTEGLRDDGSRRRERERETERVREIEIERMTEKERDRERESEKCRDGDTGETIRKIEKINRDREIKREKRYSLNLSPSSLCVTSNSLKHSPKESR